MSALHRIRVLGRELQVRSDAAADQVRSIESFVNGKLADVAGSLKGSDPQLVAILTLMNIAEEYLSLARAHEGIDQQATERLFRLLHKIEDNL